MAQVELLLKVLSRLDLRRGVSDTVAQYLKRGIFSVLIELEKKKGLPSNDPLRFDKNGIRLSREQLNNRLDEIIDSWPRYRGDWNGRETDYQGRL